MEDRLKERLTGAILLVILVVVLVPAMFRGDRPGVPGASVATGGFESQQVYTIDLKGAAPAAPEERALASAPAALPAEATGAADEAPTVERVAPSPPAVVSAPAKPLPEPKVASAASPLPAPRVSAAPTRATVVKPVAKSATAATGGFVVQVGSFSRRENAAVMVKQAANKGARLTVAGPDDRGFFRVRSPVMRTRQEAVALQEKLNSLGYKGLVGAVN